MKKLTLLLSACLFFTVAHASNASPFAIAPAGELTLREIHYDGQLSEDWARFNVELDVEATGKGASSTKLFEGDVAILPAKLPDALKIVREGKLYRMTADRAGQFKLKLDLVAKVQRAEPWNQVSFSGPLATISSVTAQANGTGSAYSRCAPRVHPGVANGSEQADDNPTAGGQHQSRELADATGKRRRGVPPFVGGDLGLPPHDRSAGNLMESKPGAVLAIRAPLQPERDFVVPFRMRICILEHTRYEKTPVHLTGSESGDGGRLALAF